VDKRNFLHRLNGLRAFQAAAQALFLARTLTGQKFGRGQTRQFRTFDPVDMHGLIHSSAGFFLQNRVFQWPKAVSKPECGPGRQLDRSGKFFSDQLRSLFRSFFR
jgi:hypothetical protein